MNLGEFLLDELERKFWTNFLRIRNIHGNGRDTV